MKSKRLLSLILSLTMVLGLAPVLTAPAAAAAAVNVTSIQELKNALERSGDVNIKIVKDISGKFDAKFGTTTKEVTTINDDGTWTTTKETVSTGSNDVWATVAAGTKTIDLNGKSVRVTYDEWKDRCSTMIVIPAGANVVVNDAKNTGSLFYNGYIPGKEKYYSQDYWEAAATQNRDLFLVDGGSLTVNGGIMDAGRSKNEWVAVATHDKWDCSEYYKTAGGVFNEYFNGYGTKYINGTAVTVKDGTVTINDGLFYGRGLQSWKLIAPIGTSADGWRTSPSHYVRNAALEAKGGKVTINGGAFYGKGNADSLRIESGVDFTLKAARLSVHHNDYVMIRSQNLAGFGDDSNGVMDGSYGSFGLPDSCYSDSKLFIVYMGENRQATPKECDEYILTNTKDLDEPYLIVKPMFAARFDLTSELDPYSELPQLNPSLTDQWIFNFDSPNVFAYHPLAAGQRPLLTNYTIQVCDEKGTYLKFSDKSDKMLLTRTTKNALTSIDLGDYPELLKQMEIGKTYYVQLGIQEILDGAAPLMTTRIGVCPVKATSVAAPIVLSQTEGTVSAGSKGANVTLTATATNATSVGWYYTGAGSRYYSIFNAKKTESVDGARRTGTITFPVTEERDVVAIFFGKAGQTNSEPIHVNYLSDPTFVTGNSTVITYTSKSSAYISNRTDDAGTIQSVTWYKDGKKLADDNHYHYMGQTLQIVKPTLDDAGEYYCVLATGRGEFTSPTTTLKVIDGLSPDQIGSVSLTTSKPLYVGAPALTMEDLNIVDDDRFKIVKVEWIYGVEDGYITEANPTMNVYLEVNLQPGGVPYTFKQDDSGLFHFTLNDMEFQSYYNPQYNNSSNFYSIRLNYSFNGNPLPDSIMIDGEGGSSAALAVPDHVSLGATSLKLTSGQSYSKALPITLDCPHSTTHTVTKVAVAEGSLPKGMSLSADGTLSGTPADVTAATDYPVTLAVTTSGGDTLEADVTFFVEPSNKALAAETKAALALAENLLADAHTEHSFGQWKDNKDGTHSHTCDECKLVETAPHSWDEGTVTKESTATAEGVMTYACVDCGATKTEAIETTTDPSVLSEVAGAENPPVEGTAQPKREKLPVTRQAIPNVGTAYASKQAVELNGAKIDLPAYALKDANGYDTNYIRLRDLADLLKATEARFDVVWTAERGISIVTQQDYAHPNGTEGNIPFSGDMGYYAMVEDTYVDGAAVPLTAYVITYQDGGHTYFQLRDLGKALGFNVGWSADRGIFIETDRSYNVND